MIFTTKIFKFEAAHYLPYHEGKCKNMHGHNYKLEVTFGGTPFTEGKSKGMVIDFSDLKQLVNESIIQKLDHALLNDYFENPTAENMVLHFINWINHEMLVGLKLWETDNCFAEWRKQ